MMKGHLLFAFLLLVSFKITAQADQFSYRRELQDVRNEWHRVILPDDIYGKVSKSLNDIRIYCINGKDTTEAPYILNEQKPPAGKQSVSFKLLNQSKNNRGYFYTFQLPVKTSVNNIFLDVKPDNFDWKTDIEGSHDQINWYIIQQDFRIAAIKNADVNFRYSQIKFPVSDYTFIRILIKSNTDPGIAGARLFIEKPSETPVKEYPSSTLVTNDKNTGKTIIDIALKYPAPISALKFHVSDSFDYYRPVEILYVTDSIKTDKGWFVNYASLSSGILNSLDTNNFIFSSAIVSGIRVSVENRDNAPLNIHNVKLTGPEYSLTARFNKKGKYYLYYGKRDASAPDYDIAHFSERIPQELQQVVTSKEELSDAKVNKGNPLFMNKMWLWVVLVITLAILGWFSIQMIREKQKQA